MQSERNRVYLQHPTEEGKLLAAQLIKENDGVLSMRLLEELLLQPQTETKQYYHGQDEHFYGFSCQVLRMESGGPNPVISVVQTGPKERHEHRQTFRVKVYDDIITAQINGKSDAEVLDVGYFGVAILTTDHDYQVDHWLQMTFLFDCAEIAGRMQVKNRNVTKDGRVRYGLMADLEDANLLNDLSKVTQSLQNVKARRASRLGKQ